eukprot:GHVU01098735.1.p2 GENE.GHVU01098735.1~~GHVU01098735.1.p2  ORF type:complete len:139 (-),score=15.75 GHVU01098735.1:115-531(-)
MTEYGTPLPDEFPVGVIDYGFRKTHEDLVGRWHTNTPENVGPPANSCSDGVDNDQNGYTDECGGRAFPPGPTSGTHGTEVSAVIAANSGNAKGLKGACSFCKVLEMKFDGSVAREIEAMNFAAAVKVKIINFSFGDAE